MLLAAIPAALSPAYAGPRVGRMGVLLDAYGYNRNGTVLVPFRGIAEWLGAEVNYRRPTVTMAMGAQKVTLTVGSRTARVNGKARPLRVPATVYGGQVCVPLAFVASALGAEATYVTDDWPICINHVRVTRDGRVARIPVNAVPPDVAAQMVAGVDEGRSEYGTEWVMAVGRQVGNWASVSMPGWTGSAFDRLNGGTLLTKRGGRWCSVFRGKAGIDRQDMARIGVPEATVRALGWDINEY